MAELKILGAQRVKALQKILDDKMKESLSEHPLPTQQELFEIADKEFFNEEWLKEYHELQEKYKALTAELQAVRQSSPHSRIRINLSSEADKYRKEIKKQFEEKKNNLWLCETMEEAKAIVGIT